jgi:hypothetical protein
MYHAIQGAGNFTTLSPCHHSALYNLASVLEIISVMSLSSCAPSKDDEWSGINYSSSSRYDKPPAFYYAVGNCLEDDTPEDGC